MIKNWVAALIAGFFSTYASAGFEIVQIEKPQSVVKDISVTQPEINAATAKKVKFSEGSLVRGASLLTKSEAMVGGLTHTGRKPAVLPPAKGFAKNLALKDALSMLVPVNFEIYNEGQVNLNNQVSWTSQDGDDWSLVLDNLLRKNQIAATLDWNGKTLSLDKQVVMAKKPEVKIFKMLSSDRTVRSTMQRWSRESGWQLDWDVAVDFPVPYDIEFNGPYENAISEVMKSLSASDYPIQACSYDNKIIRVVRYGEQQRCNIN